MDRYKVGQDSGIRHKFAINAVELISPIIDSMVYP